MDSKIKFQDSNARPICPYCEQEIGVVERIMKEKIEASRANPFTYICPHCKKILGFSGY